MTMLWILFLIAFALACLLALVRRSRYGIVRWKTVTLTVLTAIYGCVGAKLLYLLESPGKAVLLNSGFSYFGSVFLPFLLVPVTALALGVKPSAGLDLCAPYIPMTMAFLRISCVWERCCQGRILLLGDGYIRYPVAWMEHIVGILITLYLLDREKKCRDGLQYPIFMMLYGISRFFIGFLRATPKHLWGLSNGQWFALAAILIGAAMLLLQKAQAEKGGQKRK